MRLALYNVDPFIIILTMFEYFDISMMEKQSVVMKSSSMTFVIITASNSSVRFEMVVKRL